MKPNILYLEPPSRIFRVASILQTVLVALDKKFQAKSVNQKKVKR